MRRVAFLGLLVSSMALAGCTGSSRMNSFWGNSTRGDGGYARQAEAPSDDIITTPNPVPRNSAVQGGDLAPVPGTRVAPPDQVGLGGNTVIDQAQPAVAATNTQTIIAPEPSAAAPAAANTAMASAAPATVGSAGGGVSRLSGTWTMTDAGDKCRITLTSQALFEYYRATPGACKSASFTKVNAWEQRGQEVVLLEPGGKVAARLFPQGDGRYSGSTARGASVIMSR